MRASYDLMLLADPGPPRAEVIRALLSRGVQPDPKLETRFWLDAAGGEVQVNIGTKDPVESVHLTMTTPNPRVLEAAADAAMELSRALAMRLEDMQFGEEIGEDNLEAVRRFWSGWRPPDLGEPAGPRRWWRRTR